MKRITIVLFILFTFSSVRASTEVMEQFISGNNAYEKGEYKEAIDNYETVLAKGYFSAELHYNLGNAYFKYEDIAQAILHYEKALKIKPNFKDAAYNLSIANAKTIDKIEALPELFIYRWWKSIYHLFSITGWTTLLFTFVFIALIGYSTYLLSRKIKLKKLSFYSASITLSLALVCWLMAASQNRNLHAIDFAIILNPTVNINSSPSAGSSKLFVLHKGTKVRVEDHKGEWANISLPNGNKGWIKKEVLGDI